MLPERPQYTKVPWILSNGQYCLSADDAKELGVNVVKCTSSYEDLRMILESLQPEKK